MIERTTRACRAADDASRSVPATGIYQRHDFGESWMMGSGGANASCFSGCEGKN
jgi:hypothetical protein